MSFGVEEGCYGNYYETAESWREHVCNGCDEIQKCKEESS